MTEQPTPTPSDQPQRGKREHRAKLVFLAVILIVAGAIYWTQTRPPRLNAWQDDLPGALAQAREQNRPVVVFFMEAKAVPGSPTQRMISGCLKMVGVTKPLERYKYIPVAVAMDHSLDSDLARQYQLDTLPTLLFLTSTGTERERRSGFVGAAEVQAMIIRNAPITVQ